LHLLSETAGDLIEEDINETTYKYFKHFLPKYTPKNKNHRVKALEDSWCLTIRGPWQKTWTEDNTKNKKRTTFTHGRKVIKHNSVA